MQLMNSKKLTLAILGAFMLLSQVLLNAALVDIAPRPIKTPNPTFFGRIITSDAYVNLSIDIDAKGNVRNAIVRSSSHTDLEKPTLRAVRKWEFEPAFRNGKPVRTPICVLLSMSVFQDQDERSFLRWRL